MASASISLRINPEQRELIDSAASLQGLSRTDFMLSVACREAERILLDQRRFFVDDAAFQKFQELLDEPVEPNPKLGNLLNRKSPWE